MAVKDPQVVLKEAAQATKGNSADPGTHPQSEPTMITLPEEQQIPSSSLKDSGSSRGESSPSLRSGATSSAAASEGTASPPPHCRSPPVA